MFSEFPHLFSEVRIGSCTLRNRIIMGLFPTKYATDSKANKRMIEFYRARARGGAALTVLDCPCLDYPAAYKGPNELRFDTPEYAVGITTLLDAIHAEGGKAFMQVNYPKERFLDHEAPGAKPKGKGWILPLANGMSTAEVKEINGKMASGARRALELGYDGVEVQASYGDLISQLLSPLTNRRADEYGGDLNNRARFLTELVALIKAEAGHDCPVMVKLVCDEFVPSGLDISEAREIARLVEAAGADAILASGGNKATKARTIPPHSLPPASLVHLAAALKREVSVPVAAIGKIGTPALAEEILREGKADLVGMVRALVADPDLPQKAYIGRPEEIRGCVYCLEDCAEGGVPGLGRSCTVNPFAGREDTWRVEPSAQAKKVAVVGGGPAGMQAAIVLDQRGHRVILYERGEELGGQLRFADQAPFKMEMSEALRYLRHMLRGSKVEVRLEVEATAEMIIGERPEAVVLATGSRPCLPDIPGINLPFVFDVRKVYQSAPELGVEVVIIGGGDIGCETADLLAGPGRMVTVVEICEEVLRGMKDIPKAELLKRLRDKGVVILSGTRTVEIRPGTVVLEGKGGVRSEVTANNVVVAAGSLPDNTLAKSLEAEEVEIFPVGDCSRPGDLGAALRGATEMALKI